MTTVNELLPYMLMIVLVMSCWRFLGGSLRSSSRTIRSSFRDENQSWTCRIGTVLAGWLDAYNKETVGVLWNTRIPERDAGACGPIAAHRLRADGGCDAKKQILLKSVQRVNAQEPTEQASTQEISGEVSRLPRKGELVVFTFPTGEESSSLPTLLNPRTPVLGHILVSHGYFKVTASDEHISSLEVEVYDSSTSEWKWAGDLPGSVFALNEHQGGACVDDTPVCILFLKSGGRGVVAFEVETGKWVTWAIPNISCSCNTLQLVAQNYGKVYMFSERERGEHCIDELEFFTDTTRRWKNVIRLKRSDMRGLPVYPEQTSVGFGDRKLCIFNARNRDGEVYDMRDGETLLMKTSGHGDSPAADYAWKQVRSPILRFLGAMSIPPKIVFALGVLCNLLQPANAQQVTGSSNAIDPAPWLRSDTAKVAFVSALFAGGLGAAFIWKRFFCRPPTFTVANINAGLEATPPRVSREDLDSIYPLC